MGLGSKQVSSSGLDWSHTLLQAQTMELPSQKRPQNQNQNQQSELVKCPRCDSPNTKFCYYNNYSRSQPRHFCKSCKRHWTKGGTLRNVPVGGSRKNKRLKTSNPTSSSTAAATATISGSNNNQAMYPALISPSSSMRQQNFINSSNLGLAGKATFNNDKGAFVGSAFSLPQNQSLQIPLSNSRGFDTNPSSGSSSFQLSNVYSLTGEDLTITGLVPPMSGSALTQPWQGPVTSSCLDTTAITGYWNWEDLDTLVSSTDLNISWNDSEIKP